jgi:hypothetical protein
MRSGLGNAFNVSTVFSGKRSDQESLRCYELFRYARSFRRRKPIATGFRNGLVFLFRASLTLEVPFQCATVHRTLTGASSAQSKAASAKHDVSPGGRQTAHFN